MQGLKFSIRVMTGASAGDYIDNDLDRCYELHWNILASGAMLPDVSGIDF